MFSERTETWGKWNVLRIAHADGRSGFALSPERGGCLTGLWLEGQQVLDGYVDAGELELLDWGKSAILAPFPNRLRDGQYDWEGKNYQFPINEAARNNALHGFVMDQPFEVTDRRMEEDAATIELTYSYFGDRPYFPFPFELKVRYELRSGSDFEVRFELTNTGDTDMPAGLGWHPYFRLEGSADEWTLQLPVAEQIVVDARMLPTGERVPLRNFQTPAVIGAHAFDTGLALRERGKVSVTLQQGATILHYWQDGAYPFLQVFIPPARRSIALEPMTCNIDAFRNGEGLKRLGPGEKLGGKAGLSLWEKRSE